MYSATGYAFDRFMVELDNYSICPYRGNCFHSIWFSVPSPVPPVAEASPQLTLDIFYPFNPYKMYFFVLYISSLLAKSKILLWRSIIPLARVTGCDI